MKRYVAITILIIVCLILDLTFISSQTLHLIYFLPALVCSSFFITEQIRKEFQRYALILFTSVVYGLFVNVNIGLLVLSIGLVQIAKLPLSVTKINSYLDSILFQSLGFFYLFTLGLRILNSLPINLVEVTLVALLNTLIAWSFAQLLKVVLTLDSKYV